MDSVFKNLENLVPSAERQGETAYFEIFESDMETTLYRVLLAIPTGILSVSNERLRRNGAAIFFRGRCVGCSYQGSRVPFTSNWHESFSQLRLDLHAPDTVIGLCHLSIPFVVAISAVYLGYPVICPNMRISSDFINEVSEFLAAHNGSASILAVDEKEGIIALSYFFKGSCIKTYSFDGSTLVQSDEDVTEHIPLGEKVQLTAYFHRQDYLVDGFGIPLISPTGGDDFDPDKIGARKRPSKPSGESSIALELPKRELDMDDEII